MPSFDEAVAAEYERICKHPSIHSAYEGLAMIEEEFLDLKSAVFDMKVGKCWSGITTTRRDCRKQYMHELVQIAARCKRFAVDVCREKE